jgi:uroporphyrinogen-III synthase
MSGLNGLRVVVTRAVHQAEELAAPLREHGAEVLLVPVVGIAPPLDPAPLREAAAACDQYDWICFTSVNAVSAFAAELSVPRPDCRANIAVVGTATRDAALANGFVVHLVPDDYTAESLVVAFSKFDVSGTRVLLPSAAGARDVLPEGLRRLGADVEIVEAYRNAIPTGAREQAAHTFRDPFPDWVTFASSSAVDHLVELIGRDLLLSSKLASIGPATSATIRKHGLAISAEAQPHTIHGLVRALLSLQL